MMKHVFAINFLQIRNVSFYRITRNSADVHFYQKFNDPTLNRININSYNINFDIIAVQKVLSGIFHFHLGIQTNSKEFHSCRE